MTLPAFASPSDLEAIGLDLSDETRARAALATIEHVSNRIHHVSDYVWVAEDGETLVDDVPAIAYTICVDASFRRMDNPDGVTGRTETIAGFSESEQFANSSSDTYLTKGERADIAAAAHPGSGGLSTISTTRGPLETPRVVDCWIDDPDGLGGPWER